MEARSINFTNVIPSEEIIQFVHPALLHLDYGSMHIRLSIIGLTLLTYVIGYIFTIFLCNNLKACSHLHLKHRVFMSLALVRSIFGVTCIIIGCYSLFKHTNLDRDVVYGTTATAHLAMLYTVGFFIFELSAVILSDLIFKTFSQLLLTHHSLALLSYAMALAYGASYSIACRGLVLEMSTPFSCLCFVLLKAGKENSFLWRANQLILVHTFHLRSVVEFYILYLSYCNWERIWSVMPMPLLVVMYFSLCITAFILTPYWGYRKTQQYFNPVDWNFQEPKSAPNNEKCRGKKLS